MIYPGELDLEVLQGAFFYRRITWELASAPMDLTGAEIRMQARYAKLADEMLIDATTDNGLIEIEDAANGVFALRFPAELTDTFDFRTAVYDLEIEMPGGTVYRLLEGRIRVDPQVTR